MYELALAAQRARERHDELLHEAARERAAAAVAGPSLRARVALALTRRGRGTAPGPVGTTLQARPASGAGD